MPPLSPVIHLSLFNPEHTRNFVDMLLADVPALSVGLLGFATLTSFMVLKKMKLAPFLLLASVLFAFFSAVVDLARISVRSDNSTRLRKSTDRLNVSLIIAREVLTSTAFGLRFLHFWAFVSQPPLCERGSGSFLRLHSGSWVHWGLTGAVLRWTTLLASLSILVLQVIWRTVNPLRRFGPVYNIDGVLEIAASGIYMIKLLLNAMIVQVHCRRETIWQYSATLFALLLNLGIGIGNLLVFTFSESALGRLLLATELYILIVSSMVHSFSVREPIATPLPPSRDKRASSFRGLHVSFYDAGLGLVGDDIASPIRPPLSPAQRTSSWLSWNALQRGSSQLRLSYEDGRPQRSREEAERGATPSPSENRAPSVLDNIAPSSISSSDPITQGISEGFSSPINQLPIDPVYDEGRSSIRTTAAMTTSPDSPTLGPDGIRGARESSRPYRRLEQPSRESFASSQSSGYEILLREQTELERSIAALRMTYGRQSGEERRGEIPAIVSDPRERNKLRESSTTGYGPLSASNRSDFSISVFPQPPQMPRITGYGPPSSSPSALTPTRTSFNIGERGFPVSTASDDVAILAFGNHTDSAGTHYDVTSFIGDLTSSDQGSAKMYPKDSDTDSETGSADLATIITVERKSSNAVISRPRLVEKASLVSEDVISARSSTKAPHGASGGVADIPAGQRSPISDPRALPPPAVFIQAPSARSLTTPGGRVVGLPPRPKLNVSPAEG
ncbi:hypothetical protein BJV74DRAFT_575988 [Russula compacta]|nr:hypothetical protein BJV74DRAFT_575988 [Russula compacta]